MLAKIAALLRKAIERLTGYVGVVQSDHAYIHDGIGFHVTNTVTINDGATLKFQFVTPNPEDPATGKQKYIHWRPSSIGTSAAGVRYTLYEESTSISGGSAVTKLNMNRNSLKTSKIATFNTGVTATEGTAIQFGVFGTAGNPAKAAGGGGGSENEQVLKGNTAYTINLVNLGGANSAVSYDFFWYEEEKGLDAE